MKLFFTLCAILFTFNITAQYYDDFSDGNFTSDPRWFFSDMTAYVVSTDDNGYAVSLNPTLQSGSNHLTGSFRTASLLTDNTWWGCNLQFNIAVGSTSSISYYLTSSRTDLGSSSGIFLYIDFLNRSISLRNGKKDKYSIIAESAEKILPEGYTYFQCKISRYENIWQISCKINGKPVWETIVSGATAPNSVSSGFLIIQDNNFSLDLLLLQANCDENPTLSASIFPEDIIFSEIMYDPVPAVSLPAVEWVEIYNASDSTLQLGGCQLISSNKTGQLDKYMLPPHSYAVLCSPSAADSMLKTTPYVIPVTSMPSLLNTGDVLVFTDRHNRHITTLDYSPQWHEPDKEKRKGGWSLERIDLSNPINATDTWSSSIDPRGGTPGLVNSINSIVTDTVFPQISSIGIPDPHTVHIRFNKPMSDNDGSLNRCVSVSDRIGAVPSLLPPNRNILSLSLSEPLDSTHSIEISISNLCCISGHPFQDTTINLALPRTVSYSDIVFNEIMPYVSSANSKFIELYNNSDFFVDICGLSVCNPATQNSPIRCKPLSSDSKIIAPHHIAVITPEPQRLNVLSGINKSSLYITSSLPSFAATGGTVILISPSGHTIDSLRYSNRWHNNLLQDLHDISLERIDPHRSSNDSTNWHSASSASGYNTAGWPNSQRIPGNTNRPHNKPFTTDQTHFSPNNDNYLDFLSISYTMPSTGYVLYIDVYTRSGSLVDRIIDNEILGISGKIEWDGTTVSGNTIPAGLYILNIQAINSSSGHSITQKIITIKE